MTSWYHDILTAAVARLGHDDGMQWLERPNRGLDGMRPADLCGDEFGARLVLAALDRQVERAAA